MERLKIASEEFLVHFILVAGLIGGALALLIGIVGFVLIALAFSSLIIPF